MACVMRPHIWLWMVTGWTYSDVTIGQGSCILHGCYGINSCERKNAYNFTYNHKNVVMHGHSLHNSRDNTDEVVAGQELILSAPDDILFQ